MLKVAACQYAIELLPDWEAYCAKIQAQVSKAKDNGAKLLLLPEYAGIEVVFNPTGSDLELFTQIQSKLTRYIEYFQQLAIAHQLYIQPGTTLFACETQKFYNRAYFFSPSGKYGYQDKLQLVSDEKQGALLKNGQQQTLFNTDIGAIGVAICYDSEFPQIVSSLTQAGAKLILVPSYTPSVSSFHRVFLSCRARALENQCYVLMASAIHKTQFSDKLEQLHGQAQLFGPVDSGFSENGIIVQGDSRSASIITGDIDYKKLEQIRLYGDTHNFNDSKKLTAFELDEINL